MEDSVYTPPVDRFLTLGRPKHNELEKWTPNDRYGIGVDDIPQLVRMLRDPELNRADAPEPQWWAPIHAWRALSQFQAPDTLCVMLDVLDVRQQWQDEWSGEDMLLIFQGLGPAVVPALAQFAQDPSRSANARGFVAEALGKIGRQHADSRQNCLDAVLGQLQYYIKNDVPLNTILVMALLDLKAVEAAPLIREAYHAERVEPTMVGDWGDVRKELGLARQDGDPPERAPGESLWDNTPLKELARRLSAFKRAGDHPRYSIPGYPPGTDAPPRRGKREREKHRAQRKKARQSRRQNRRHR